MDNGAECYRRYRNGDDAGLAEMIDEYGDGLIFYLNTYVHNLSVAEELAEDTFVRLATRKPTYVDRSSFKTWLYAIARNLAIDWLRREKRRKTVSAEEWAETAADDSEIEQTVWCEERKRLLHQAMQGLKYEYRQVLWLCYFEELSSKEIAQVMKKSVNSVDHLLSRARRSLRTKLDKEDFLL